MKKILFVFATVFVFGVSNLFADNDKPVTKNDLPAQAQQFINENFAGVKLLYAKLECDFLERSYEVGLADDIKLEFTAKGVWKEVDCRNSEVPCAIIPQQIKDYVKENYNGVKIIKIERDRGDYEVQLSNRYELTFNKDFKITDIDN